jgi:D-alanyl-D-alanine carboxypeptidase/D-alanyl-D-alanine-endopeptidase (penicillin-binding protein 4)
MTPLVLIALALAGGTRVTAATEPPLQAAARRLVGAGQGVLARAEDGTVLAALLPDRPVHPASVTKIPTTLALLERLGPEHRFETRLLATGPLAGGTLRGDLLVESGGDPVLVFENAFLMLVELRALGLDRVGGVLDVRGPLLFDWKPDPGGRAFRRALEGRSGQAAWPAVRALRPDAGALGDVALVFGERPVAGGSPSPRPLVVHRSPPLVRVVKALNCYSNNVFHPLSERIGGPAEVERVARARVPAEMRDEVRIDDAAGGGTTNRLSPRAAVALLDALARALRTYDLSLPHVLPVAGVDPGTLERRLEDPATRGAVVAKTGTIGSLGASALAGVARTARWGEVTFAVLNHGLPVPEAQRRQDAFVRALLAAGGAEPWPWERRDAPVFAAAQVTPAPAGRQGE